MDDSLEVKPVEEAKEKSYVDVKVIRESDQSALVEYREKGIVERATIPLKALIDGNKVREWQLKKGIPFGIDWSDIDIPKVTPQMLTQALRLKGIWTAADVRANPQAVRNAISQVQGELFSQIVKYIIGK